MICIVIGLLCIPIFQQPLCMVCCVYPSFSNHYLWFDVLLGFIIKDVLFQQHYILFAVYLLGSDFIIRDVPFQQLLYMICCVYLLGVYYKDVPFQQQLLMVCCVSPWVPFQQPLYMFAVYTSLGLIIRDRPLQQPRFMVCLWFAVYILGVYIILTLPGG